MTDTILVTGGAGFIGSNLIDDLSRECRVIVVDDLSTGKLSNLKKSIDRIEFVQSKIEDLDLFNFNRIDGVIHLAAQASVSASVNNFKKSSLTNIQGAINILDFCSRDKVPLVYASSSAVYGNLPLGSDEVHDVDLLSPYAGDKYAMEMYARIAHEVYELSSIGLRFFNVYGPRQNPGNPYSGVISIFIDRLLRKQIITINGGYQTRDFVYVKDVVGCIRSALKLTQKKSVCTTMNILTGGSVSVNKLADLVAFQIGVLAEIVYKDLPVGDPEVSKGTIDKLTRMLDIKLDEFTDIEVGLKDTILYIKKHLPNE